jgi:uncharacterized SAM-binding protein YcdF (DUF218 family)
MTLLSLEKTLALLVMPTGLIWLLILAAALLCLRRRQPGSAALCLGIAVLYACAGSPYLGRALMASLERRVAPVSLAALEPFDAVFVLGGGSEEDSAGGPELGPMGDRVFLAARLWHAGKARLLVASGAARDGVSGIRDAGQETRALWRAVGIPDRAILPVPEPCWNTRDEIRAYARLQARHGWRRMALVSSASHLPRAMALASRAGLAFTPLGADRRGRMPAFQLHQLIPQGEGFDLTQRACWEYLGRWLGK